MLSSFYFSLPASLLASEIPENPMRLSPTSSNATYLVNAVTTGNPPSLLASSAAAPSESPSPFFNPMSSLARSDCPTAMSTIEPTSLSLSTSSLYLSNNDSSLFPDPHYPTASPQPALSATALLQKAAQMGAGASNASLVRGLGLAISSTTVQDHSATMQWNTLSHIKQEADNLGLGLPCGNNAGFADVIMGSSDPFGGQPMTRDLLGLNNGGNGGGATSVGLPALLNSFGGNFQTSGEGGGGGVCQ